MTDSRTRTDGGLLDLCDVRAAHERIRETIERTPLLGVSPGVWVKAESLQRTGSFKLRGAVNTLARALPEIRDVGVVVHSSGNHAQAIAYAAQRLGVRATCVMPCTAPAIKRDRVRSLGAEIVEVGPVSDERAEVAHELAQRRGARLVPPSDDADVIAGQGTVGLELVEQLTASLALADQDHSGNHGAGVLVLVPIGGGGLASGVSLAVKALWPRAQVFGVEPRLAADAKASLGTGRIVRWPAEEVRHTVADGLRHTSIGPLTFLHMRKFLDGVIVVEEDEIVEAIAFLASEARLTVEPSGAVSTAGLRHHRDELPIARQAICVVSGGNVNPADHAHWVIEGIAHSRQASGRQSDQ